jgi:pimeloyl-ACP methyl ester carboxylesterase
MARPDLLRKLVILNVPHPSAIAREVRRSLRQKLKLTYQLFFQLPVLPEMTMRLFGKLLLRRAGSFTKEERDEYARQWRGDLTPMLNYYRALRHARRGGRKQFQRVDVPTLIIWGENEPVFLPSGLENIAQWVSNVRIERIADAGHFVQRDAPERVSELIIHFAR